MPLALEHGPLPHAELVLLVDDDQAEVGELDVLLDQRLRADGDVHLALGELPPDRSARCLLRAVGEQLDRHASIPSADC